MRKITSIILIIVLLFSIAMPCFVAFAEGTDLTVEECGFYTDSHQRIYTMAEGKFYGRARITNNSDDLVTAYMLATLYQGDMLVDYRIQTAEFGKGYIYLSNIYTPFEIKGDVSEYSAKIIVVHDFGSIMPLCKAEEFSAYTVSPTPSPTPTATPTPTPTPTAIPTATPTPTPTPSPVVLSPFMDSFDTTPVRSYDEKVTFTDVSYFKSAANLYCRNAGELQGVDSYTAKTASLVYEGKFSGGTLTVELGVTDRYFRDTVLPELGTSFDTVGWSAEALYPWIKNKVTLYGGITADEKAEISYAYKESANAEGRVAMKITASIPIGTEYLEIEFADIMWQSKIYSVSVTAENTDIPVVTPKPTPTPTPTPTSVPEKCDELFDDFSKIPRTNERKMIGEYSNSSNSLHYDADGLYFCYWSASDHATVHKGDGTLQHQHLEGNGWSDYEYETYLTYKGDFDKGMLVVETSLNGSNSYDFNTFVNRFDLKIYASSDGLEWVELEPDAYLFNNYVLYYGWNGSGDKICKYIVESLPIGTDYIKIAFKGDWNKRIFSVQVSKDKSLLSNGDIIDGNGNPQATLPPSNATPTPEPTATPAVVVCDEVFDDYSAIQERDINLPLANFVGKEGVKFSYAEVLYFKKGSGEHSFMKRGDDTKQDQYIEGYFLTDQLNDSFVYYRGDFSNALLSVETSYLESAGYSLQQYLDAYDFKVYASRDNAEWIELHPDAYLYNSYVKYYDGNFSGDPICHYIVKYLPVGTKYVKVGFNGDWFNRIFNVTITADKTLLSNPDLIEANNGPQPTLPPNLLPDAPVNSEYTLDLSSEYMSVDTPVSASVASETEVVPDGITYEWYVDQTMVSNTEQYTPTVNDLQKFISVFAYSEGEVITSKRMFFSRLPVMYIDTDDGWVITSKTDYKSAHLTIQGNELYNSSNSTLYDGKIEIRGRGNSTWGLPKKPYKIKLDKSTKLFDMSKGKEWALLANYLDESLIRNGFASRYADQVGNNGMDNTWVEVVLNGNHVGNYELFEQLEIGNGRVDIYDWEETAEDIADAVMATYPDRISEDDRDNIEDNLQENLEWITTETFWYNGYSYNVSDYVTLPENINGGVLLEFSQEYDAQSQFRTNRNMPIMIDGPETLATNSQFFNTIINHVNNFENAIYSPDFCTDINGKRTGYAEIADIDALISFWLVGQMFMNELDYKSQFFSIDIDGKIVFGPPWDFDFSSGSNHPWGEPGTNDYWRGYSWFTTVFKDPYFALKGQELYLDTIDQIKADLADGGWFDRTRAYLAESGESNEDMWYYKRGFNGDYDALENWIKGRIAWLDDKFQSESTILDSVGRHRSSQMTVVACDMDENPLESDTRDQNPAKAVVPDGEDIKLVITTINDPTVSVNIMINGRFYMNVPFVDRKAVVTVPESELDEEYGTKNVVFVFGLDSSGNFTKENYTSIRQYTSEPEDGTVKIAEYQNFGGLEKTEIAAENGVYPFTYGDATLKASLGNGLFNTLYWSDSDYKYADDALSATVPVMVASDATPWGENPLYEIECSTTGYSNITVTAKIGASKKGPKNYKLQYSIDGESFNDVAQYSLTTNKEMEKPFENVRLPDDTSGVETLYIRIVVNGTETVAGETTLDSTPTSGETAVNGIVIRGILE